MSQRTFPSRQIRMTWDSLTFAHLLRRGKLKDRTGRYDVLSSRRPAPSCFWQLIWVRIHRKAAIPPEWLTEVVRTDDLQQVWTEKVNAGVKIIAIGFPDETTPEYERELLEMVHGRQDRLFTAQFPEVVHNHSLFGIHCFQKMNLMTIGEISLAICDGR